MKSDPPFTLRTFYFEFPNDDALSIYFHTNKICNSLKTSHRNFIDCIVHDENVIFSDKPSFIDAYERAIVSLLTGISTGAFLGCFYGWALYL